jgi:GTPase SAR1 family protein
MLEQKMGLGHSEAMSPFVVDILVAKEQVKLLLDERIRILSQTARRLAQLDIGYEDWRTHTENYGVKNLFVPALRQTIQKAQYLPAKQIDQQREGEEKEHYPEMQGLFWRHYR